MKKICFIVPTLKKGGMERVVSELSNFLVSEYDITIICPFGSIVSYEINPEVKLILNSQKTTFKSLYFLFMQIRRSKADVVVGFSEFLNPFTVIFSVLAGKNVYISDRSNPLKKRTVRDNFLMKLFYPLATGIIAQTNFAKDYFISKNYNKKIEVLNNPLMKIDNTNFNPELKSIVTVGRLTPTKNQKDLLKIFSSSDNSGWQLFIVGDGQCRVELEKLAKIMNINDKVVFTGEVDDVAEYLNKSSIFAFTSLSEGFPNALNEAIAFPLAAIAYDCRAGVADLIIDGVNGYLIPEGNTELFTKKLNDLMRDSAKREKMMKEGYKSRRKYDIKKISNEFLRIISK